jgi:hypothetical protein
VAADQGCDVAALKPAGNALVCPRVQARNPSKVAFAAGPSSGNVGTGFLQQRTQGGRAGFRTGVPTQRPCAFLQKAWTLRASPRHARAWPEPPLKKAPFSEMNCRRSEPGLSRVCRRRDRLHTRMLRSRQCGQSAWRAHTGSRSTDPASDEPVEHPTMFEWAINLQAAKAIGFYVPPSLAFVRQQVIE